MALTLVMMAAVVTVFANVTSGVANRRATAEMSSQMRRVRNLLQADLAGATCPAIPWQRPDSNHGYLEVVEGPQSDYDPSIWLQDTPTQDGIPDEVVSGRQLDLAVSLLPGSNVMQLPGSSVKLTDAPTDGRALGDWDDILALTVRNETEPFVGRVPDLSSPILATGRPLHPFNNSEVWRTTETTSPLAEVVWFAVENPVPGDPQTFYFGEPGLRTVYRRVLLIAPHLNYRFDVGNQVTGPGVVRVLPDSVTRNQVAAALAALIAFQERYDLSVRLEWDPLLGDPDDQGRWKIVANSLADLTKRENRFEHHGAVMAGNSGTRQFPFPLASAGQGVSPDPVVAFQKDIEPIGVDSVVPMDNEPAGGRARRQSSVFNNTGVNAYRVTALGANYGNRPFAYVETPGGVPPTVRAIVDENGQVVHLTNGLVPLSGGRRGEDVVLSSMLAFDVRVFDPQAPLLAEIPDPTDANYPGEVLEPSDPSWGPRAYNAPNIVARGAYVDLAYWTMHRVFSARNDLSVGSLTLGQGEALFGGSPFAVMSNPRAQLAPHSDPSTTNPYGDNFYDAYRTYGTWSWHYENNGIDEDQDSRPALVDEGTNGFDDDGANGVDDVGERETAPPYDAPLRGVQVTLRAYEPDSRSIREVKVKQTFVPK